MNDAILQCHILLAFFCFSSQSLQENINHLETEIGGQELAVELYVTLEASGHIVHLMNVHFKKFCFYEPLVKTSHRHKLYDYENYKVLNHYHQTNS